MTQTVEQPKCTRIEVGHSQTSRKQWKNSPMSNSAERTTEMKSTKMSKKQCTLGTAGKEPSVGHA